MITYYSMWRMDTSNAFLELARSGLPRMNELQVDAKRDLDSILRLACISLKANALKLLFGGIEAFLVKVSAFIG